MRDESMRLRSRILMLLASVLAASAILYAINPRLSELCA